MRQVQQAHIALLLQQFGHQDHNIRSSQLHADEDLVLSAVKFTGATKFAQSYALQHGSLQQYPRVMHIPTLSGTRRTHTY